MKIPRACALIIAVLSLAAVLPAGESWRAKPSTQWNKKEARRVLENSPWAHRIKLIVARGVEAAESVPTPAERSTSASSSTNPQNQSGRLARVHTSVDDAPALNPARNAEITPLTQTGVAGVAVVRWASARTAREALARNGVLRGSMTEQQGRELSQADFGNVYVIYVDLRVSLRDVKSVPQGGVLTSAIAQNSYLLLRRTGDRVMPLGVKAAPLPEFDDRKELSLAAFYIIFPRRIDGKPTIPNTESLVRFECPLSPVPIHFEFNLNKMLRDNSPDL